MKPLDIYLFLLQEKEWEGEDFVDKNDLELIRQAIKNLDCEEDLNDKRHEIQPTLLGLLVTYGGDYKGRRGSSNMKREPRGGFSLIKKYLPKNWKQILTNKKIK